MNYYENTIHYLFCVQLQYGTVRSSYFNIGTCSCRSFPGECSVLEVSVKCGIGAVIIESVLLSYAPLGRCIIKSWCNNKYCCESTRIVITLICDSLSHCKLKTVGLVNGNGMARDVCVACLNHPYVASYTESNG